MGAVCNLFFHTHSPAMRPHSRPGQASQRGDGGPHWQGGAGARLEALHKHKQCSNTNARFRKSPLPFAGRPSSPATPPALTLIHYRLAGPGGLIVERAIVRWPRVALFIIGRPRSLREREKVRIKAGRSKKKACINTQLFRRGAAPNQVLARQQHWPASLRVSRRASV